MLKRSKKTRYLIVTDEERIEKLKETIADLKQRNFASDIIQVYEAQLIDLIEFIKKEKHE